MHLLGDRLRCDLFFRQLRRDQHGFEAFPDIGVGLDYGRAGGFRAGLGRNDAETAHRAAFEHLRQGVPVETLAPCLPERLNQAVQLVDFDTRVDEQCRYFKVVKQTGQRLERA